MVPMGAAGEKCIAENFIKLSHFHHFFEKLAKFVEFSIGVPILVINNIIFLRSKVSAKILTKYLKVKSQSKAPLAKNLLKLFIFWRFSTKFCLALSAADTLRYK